jgi:hypothetical protein
MPKHVNHFDAQSKIANSFKTISIRNEDDEEDLSLKAQLEAEAKRKQLKQGQPKQVAEQKKRYAGWVVVRSYDIKKKNKRC